MLAVVLLFAAIVAAPAPVVQEPRVSVDDFAASDVAGKRRILNDIAASRSRVPIEHVIEFIRAGLRDRLVEVRVAAMAAVGGRAMASRSAGLDRSVIPAEWKVIPAEWKGDQLRLRDALYEDCLAVLRSDPDLKVRHYALIAIGNLERPFPANGPMRDEFVAVLIERYRQDADPRIRAEVVKTFSLTPNDSPAIRAVLRDALVDPAGSVRRQAISMLNAQALGGRSKLPFEDARPTILTSLKHPDSWCASARSERSWPLARPQPTASPCSNSC